ncbi:membrane protein YqaA with SNARE-associated domain [Rhizobium sp. BK316]|uniref:YqaA family protein n=1 Tax=Rhizobium sp. BK316 TaxID=2587053 RepID=UPI00185D04AF|nr:YqaA family protein [Rhizobium sp. BK316]MBB3407360.1 membrane protein YqaA with SNARE-associated domain [Rhizobium sp. BK316]
MLTAVSTMTGLFLVAFAAATIFPMQSEAALAGLVLAGQHPPVLLVAVASTGNTLGAVVNWVLGRGVERFRSRRWFPVGDAALDRASRWYRRYGRWSLLLSWMPLFGDALTVAAGVLREPLLPFLLLVFVAKTGRYVALVLAVLGVVG